MNTEITNTNETATNVPLSDKAQARIEATIADLDNETSKAISESSNYGLDDVELIFVPQSGDGQLVSDKANKLLSEAVSVLGHSNTLSEVSLIVNSAAVDESKGTKLGRWIDLVLSLPSIAFDQFIGHVYQWNDFTEEIADAKRDNFPRLAHALFCEHPELLIYNSKGTNKAQDRMRNWQKRARRKEKGIPAERGDRFTFCEMFFQAILQNDEAFQKQLINYASLTFPKKSASWLKSLDMYVLVRMEELRKLAESTNAPK